MSSNCPFLSLNYLEHFDKITLKNLNFEKSLKKSVKHTKYLPDSRTPIIDLWKWGLSKHTTSKQTYG